MGIFPNPTKSILVVALWNVARAGGLFWGMVLKVVTGSCYLGGLIGDWETETT